MHPRLAKLWDEPRTSYWVVPLAMGISAVIVGMIMPWLDARWASAIAHRLPWLQTTMDAARASLSAIAGAMVTVTGVVFSLTMVTLSIAASQFGSRIVRARMTDRVTQFALGTFVATSLYCLVVLQAVRVTDGEPFAPHVSAALGLLLAIASLGILIHYIHHVALSVQASIVISTVAEDLEETLQRVFPEETGQVEDASEPLSEQAAALEGEGQPVEARAEGYLQAVDLAGLIRAAQDSNLVLRLQMRPGAFVTRGCPIAQSWPAEAADEVLCRRINQACLVGRRRTPVQDAECAVSELVEIAMRALSSGINDPLTAVSCVDYLGAALSRLCGRKMPRGLLADGPTAAAADHAGRDVPGHFGRSLQPDPPSGPWQRHRHHPPVEKPRGDRSAGATRCRQGGGPPAGHHDSSWRRGRFYRAGRPPRRARALRAGHRLARRPPSRSQRLSRLAPTRCQGYLLDLCNHAAI
jgi:uncharacterized membrane protein